jgi:hypothetical protein
VIADSLQPEVTARLISSFSVWEWFLYLLYPYLGNLGRPLLCNQRRKLVCPLNEETCQESTMSWYWKANFDTNNHFEPLRSRASANDCKNRINIFTSVWFWIKINNQIKIIFFSNFLTESKTDSNQPVLIRFGSLAWKCMKWCRFCTSQNTQLSPWKVWNLGIDSSFKTKQKK